MAIHDPDASAQEKAQALKIGRQKRLQLINGQQVGYCWLLYIHLFCLTLMLPINPAFDGKCSGGHRGNSTIILSLAFLKNSALPRIAYVICYKCKNKCLQWFLSYRFPPVQSLSYLHYFVFPALLHFCLPTHHMYNLCLFAAGGDVHRRCGWGRDHGCGGSRWQPVCGPWGDTAPGKVMLTPDEIMEPHILFFLTK